MKKGGGERVEGGADVEDGRQGRGPKTDTAAMPETTQPMPSTLALVMGSFSPLMPKAEKPAAATMATPPSGAMVDSGTSAYEIRSIAVLTTVLKKRPVARSGRRQSGWSTSVRLDLLIRLNPRPPLTDPRTASPIPISYPRRPSTTTGRSKTPQPGGLSAHPLLERVQQLRPAHRAPALRPDGAGHTRMRLQ